MKKLILTIALASAFALPMASTSMADPWYIVKRDDGVNYGGGAGGVTGFGVPLMSQAHGKGHRKCVVPKGEIVHRDWGENWSRWIYVKWRPGGDDLDGHFGGVGSEGYCPVWNMHGWIDKRFLASDNRGVDPNAGIAANTNWYVTKQPTEIKSDKPKNGQPRGNHRCTVPKNEYVHRDNSDKSGEPHWIYVRWKKAPLHSVEWNFKGTWGPGLNNWCQDWNRHGWVYVGKLRPVPDPNW